MDYISYTNDIILYKELYSMTKNSTNYLFFLVFITLAFALMIKLLAPFATVIFFAYVFYVVLNPLYKRILEVFYKIAGKKTGKMAYFRKIVFSLFFSLLSLLIFLLPTVLLFYVIIMQIVDLTNILTVFFKDAETQKTIKDTIVYVISKLPFNLSANDIVTKVQDSLIAQMASLSGYLTQNIASIVKGTGSFITSFVFMMFTLFFLFIDGQYLSSQVMPLIPIDTKYTERLLSVAGNGIKGIIYGNLFTGIVQAIIGFIVFYFFKIPNAAMFASLLVIASFIPIVGTGIIWVPLGIIMIFQMGVFKAILFFVVCSLTISMSDNFTRPLFLGNRVSLHPLFIFFAILGGIFLFGLTGIILGPLCFILFFESMKIFNEIKNNRGTRKVKKYNTYFM